MTPDLFLRLSNNFRATSPKTPEKDFMASNRRAVMLCYLLGLLMTSRASADEPRNLIRGRVLFGGKVPKAKMIDESGRNRDLIEVDPKTSGLRFAAMFLLDAPKSEVPAKLEELRIDQKDFTFVPRIVTVRAGQVVKFTNSDSANHNVRGASLLPKNEFNVYTGTRGESVQRFVADPKNRPIRLGCDIHAWMTGWIYVFDHPYHAVTDSNGQFELRGVPSGKHRLAIRQPDVGFFRNIEVEVTEFGATNVEVRFREDDLRLN